MNVDHATVQIREAVAVPLLSLFAASEISPAAGLSTRARTPARANERGEPAETVMPWAEFIPHAHGVMRAHFAAMGHETPVWDALDDAARRRWREVLGALDRCQVHGSAACARMAYEETRAHERVVERPTLPWGALPSAEREPWVFAGLLVALWRTGL